MSTLLARYLTPFIKEDLKKKMVFVGGPRQVGKTTMAKQLIKNFADGHAAYLNWDDAIHKNRIKNRDWPKTEPLIVLDEIHKNKLWRNFVKGLYDTLKNTHSFLVTGSARLDHFRKGGDSLLGRYHYYRLHPYSLPEIKYPKNGVNDLLKFGGFPEPFHEKDEVTLRRWHLQRVDRLIGTDLRDLESVKDINQVQTLAELLPSRVGAPLSIASLSRDVEVDFKTIKRWIEILESLYYSYRIAPYGTTKIRAVKKEQKLYLWDWSQVENPGARFENMVASHLLKYCHFIQDTQGYRMELRYLRDADVREVDFVVLKNNKPIFAVECKTGEVAVSPHLYYFSERTPIPKFYQVHLGKKHQQINEKIELIPFEEFCKAESLV